eukprot:COSAG02_NODE_23_length_52893_cov_58.101868_20_plen_74_part_00
MLVCAIVRAVVCATCTAVAVTLFIAIARGGDAQRSKAEQQADDDLLHRAVGMRVSIPRCVGGGRPPEDEGRLW